MASLIDYNAVLYEDDTINAMKECLDLFETVTNTRVFKKSDTSTILLLNKDDLLKQLLEKTPNNGLELCFSEAGGWKNKEEYWDTNIDDKYITNELPMDVFHDIVIKFIESLFKKRNGAGHMYHHVIVAIDNHVVQKVFWDLQSIIVRRNMNEAGFPKDPQEL